jgi:hypothetical protein
MADTATLRHADLNDFLLFAERMGYESLPTRRDFEVLRLKKGHAPTVVLCRREREPGTIWAQSGEASRLVNYWRLFRAGRGAAR